MKPTFAEVCDLAQRVVRNRDYARANKVAGRHNIARIQMADSRGWRTLRVVSVS